MKNNNTTASERLKKQIKLLIAILVIFILSYCCSVYILNTEDFFSISDNQKLYFFSTGAQVLAGLFGIIIAAYVFFIDKMNKEVENDDSLFDVVKEIKEKNYYKIIHMGTILFITLLSCFINITIKAGCNTFLSLFFGFSGSILLLYELCYIVTFAISVVDPSKIGKTSQKLRKEEDIKEHISDETVELGDFLKQYNALEMVIIDAASHIDGWSERWTGKQNSLPKFMQALRFLSQKEILSIQEVDQINEIRRYRNLTVHSISPQKVSKNIYNGLMVITDDIMNRMEKIKPKNQSEDQ